MQLAPARREQAPVLVFFRAVCITLTIWDVEIAKTLEIYYHCGTKRDIIHKI